MCCFAECVKMCCFAECVKMCRFAECVRFAHGQSPHIAVGAHWSAATTLRPQGASHFNKSIIYIFSYFQKRVISIRIMVFKRIDS